MQIVPFLFLRGHQQQHQIGADGKIRGLVGDHHGVEIGFEALHAGVNHRDDVVADGVHLGVKFAAKHAVAEIDQAGAGSCVCTVFERSFSDFRMMMPGGSGAGCIAAVERSK